MPSTLKNVRPGGTEVSPILLKLIAVSGLPEKPGMMEK
jgi:hypothetical protein